MESRDLPNKADGEEASIRHFASGGVFVVVVFGGGGGGDGGGGGGGGGVCVCVCVRVCARARFCFRPYNKLFPLEDIMMCTYTGIFTYTVFILQINPFSTFVCFQTCLHNMS